MRRLAIILTAALALTATAFAQVRTITRTNDILDDAKGGVFFFQREDVTYNLFVQQNAIALPVHSNGSPVLYVRDSSLTNYVLVNTGSVVSASGGQLRFSIAYTSTAITAATYEAGVVMYDNTPAAATNRFVADRFQLTVKWSPAP